MCFLKFYQQTCSGISFSWATFQLKTWEQTLGGNPPPSDSERGEFLLTFVESLLPVPGGTTPRREPHTLFLGSIQSSATGKRPEDLLQRRCRDAAWQPSGGHVTRDGCILDPTKGGSEQDAKPLGGDAGAVCHTLEGHSQGDQRDFKR